MEMERLITHLSAGALHVCGLGGLPLIGLSCVGGWDVVVVEGVEGAGVAGTFGSDGRCGSTGCTTGWHIWLAAQTSVIVIDVVENIVVPGEIMMVSMDFCSKDAQTYRFVLF